MSGGKDRGVGPRERRDCPSTSSMDDWYLEVCKRNVNRLSVIDGKQRERSGSLKPTVTFVTGESNAFAALLFDQCERFMLFVGHPFWNASVSRYFFVLSCCVAFVANKAVLMAFHLISFQYRCFKTSTSISRPAFLFIRDFD